MPTLYALADAREVLDRLVEENEGELTPELEQALDELDGATEEKIERVALWIKERMHDCEGIRAEEQRLMKRRHAIFNGASALREYLARNMARLGKTEVRGLLISVGLRETELRVEGELSDADMATLYLKGADYITYHPPSYAIDRKRLNQHVRNGTLPPPGLAIAPTSTFVVIR
jgi:hypothetical protein